MNREKIIGDLLKELSQYDHIERFLNIHGETGLTDDEVLRIVITTLTPREEKVIRMHLGIGKDRLSVKEIVQQGSWSESTVYRTLKRALAKLNAPPRNEFFAYYLKLMAEGPEAFRPLSLVQIDAIEYVKQLTPELIQFLKTHKGDLDKLRWDVFEHLVAEFFAGMGFQDVRLVGRNPHTSADIYVATRLAPLQTEIRLFIEVKRWKDKVGVQVIDQVYGAMLSERPKFGWNAAMIISIAGFTEFEKYNHRELSLRGIELKDRQDLLKWLEEYEPNKNGLWLPKPTGAGSCV